MIFPSKWLLTIPPNFQMWHDLGLKLQGNAYPMNKRFISPPKEKQMGKDLEGQMDPPYLSNGWFNLKEIMRQEGDPSGRMVLGLGFPACGPQRRELVLVP